MKRSHPPESPQSRDRGYPRRDQDHRGEQLLRDTRSTLRLVTSTEMKETAGAYLTKRETERTTLQRLSAPEHEGRKTHAKWSAQADPFCVRSLIDLQLLSTLKLFVVATIRVLLLIFCSLRGGSDRISLFSSKMKNRSAYGWRVLN